MPRKNLEERGRRLEEIGRIFIEHRKTGSIPGTMSKLYHTHKKFGSPETFTLNRRFYRRLL